VDSSCSSGVRVSGLSDTTSGYNPLVQFSTATTHHVGVGQTRVKWVRLSPHSARLLELPRRLGQTDVCGTHRTYPNVTAISSDNYYERNLAFDSNVLTFFLDANRGDYQLSPHDSLRDQRVAAFRPSVDS
jgi:hypothetical protein